MAEFRAEDAIKPRFRPPAWVGLKLLRFAPWLFTAAVIGGVVTIWAISLLAPLHLPLVRDLLGVTGVVGFVSLVAMFAIWWERKVAGRIQSRVGPMRVGGWHGWAQSLADGLKLIQKEDLVPAGADQPLFRLAPYIAFVPALCAFAALPFSVAWVFRDLDVALLFILAMLGIEVIGVILAGWASNNKWSLYGAMREACQMVSYEIPLGFALLVPIMTVGTLQLSKIGDVQSGGFHAWLAFANPWTFIAAFSFFLASLASCKRAPFDLPEAESELVGGFHTEYSGYRWAIFFFAEYAGMFIVSGMAVILFFGAWHSPLPGSWGAGLAQGPLWQRALHGLIFSGPLWFIVKSFVFVFIQIWLRWTLPRIRLDQVMYACIQVLLPMVMLTLAANTVWGLLVDPAGLLARILNVILAAIAAVFLLVYFGMACYGYINRRRLVGTQAVEALPGA
jgi:NADH-quinone oxidoreductase subunit H